MPPEGKVPLILQIDNFRKENIFEKKENCIIFYFGILTLLIMDIGTSLVGTECIY